MGYTHYYGHKRVTKKVWDDIVKDVKVIMANLPKYSLSSGGYYPDVELKLADGMGKVGTKPIINGDVIVFNGLGPQYSHETFKLLRKGSDGFYFCKTARKPYDLVVQACLLIYKYHSPGTIHLESDGDDSAWKAAIGFVNKLFGYKLPYKLFE